MMGATSNKNLDFFLNLRGNLTVGVQLLSLIPLTLSIEDVELYLAGDEVKETYLLGVALVLPVGHIFGINTNKRQTVLTSTLGTRGNSTAPGSDKSWPAMQLKLRFLESDSRGENRVSFSAYSSFLYDLSERANFYERKGSLGLAVNNLVGFGTQVGVEGSYTNLKANSAKNEAGSIIFFLGGDMF